MEKVVMEFRITAKMEAPLLLGQYGNDNTYGEQQKHWNIIIERLYHNC